MAGILDNNREEVKALLAFLSQDYESLDRENRYNIIFSRLQSVFNQPLYFTVSEIESLIVAIRKFPFFTIRKKRALERLYTQNLHLFLTSEKDIETIGGSTRHDRISQWNMLDLI